MAQPAPIAADATKAQAYSEVRDQILAVIAGESSRMARYATASALLAQSFPHFFWTGFYVRDGDRDELVVGPYQGTLGCLRIPFGRGVCGSAAAEGVTQVVEDVHAFPGHIACDARSESEIVVPVWKGDTLLGVLDVDSTRKGAFDTRDADALERICAMVAV